MNKLNYLFQVLIGCYLILLQISDVLCRSQTRIVGGTATTIDKAPFVVQILSNGGIICSGSLITNMHVLTAAHCFDNKPERLVVAGGTTKLTDFGVRRKVRKILMPTDYNNDTFNSDIAVLTLKKPMIGETVKPIELCKREGKSGARVRLYGWGKRKHKADTLPIRLQTVEVRVVYIEYCKKALRDEQPLTDSMFCAAAPGKDACSGDSGGPAVINNQLCGVISWGVGCANKDLPGVFTSTKKMEKFIQFAIQK